MGETTGIWWTNHTFNPWWGCTKVSPGCDHCYAEALDRRWGGMHWGKGFTRREFGEEHWKEPLRWDCEHAKAGSNGLVFCASMADVMDDEAPFEARERLWRLIDSTPHLTWQLLTKRPQRYERYLPSRFAHNNVWLGTTTEDQPNFNLRWPILAKVAYERDMLPWISYEPALGPLTLVNFPMRPKWIIFGGESGNHRRTADPQWARDLYLEISEYMPFCKLFVKQMSARTPEQGKKLIPPDLMIQEFPSRAERGNRSADLHARVTEA